MSTCYSCWISSIAVAYGAAYLALKAGKVPPAVARVWSVAHLAGLLIFMNVASFFLHNLRLLGVKPEKTKDLCTYLCSLVFWLVCATSPHIQIEEVGSTMKWSDIPERSMMCINHCSFFDPFLFVGEAPVGYIYNCKTLMKDSLRKIPIMGPIFDRVGHFPVYFRSDKENDFGVDKEKQEAVMAGVNAHLASGGRLALYPEGVVNVNPQILKSFRVGSFNLIVQHKLPLYYMITIGNNDTWPAGAAVGGLPAKIRYSVHQYPVDYSKEVDAKALCEGLQKAMQQKVDEAFAKWKPTEVKKAQ